MVEKKEKEPESISIKMFMDIDEYIKLPKDVKEAIKDEKSTVTFKFEIASRKQVDMQALLDGKPNQQTTHTELNIIGLNIVELPDPPIKEKPEGWMVKKIWEEAKKNWEESQPVKKYVWENKQYKDPKDIPNAEKPQLIGDIEIKKKFSIFGRGGDEKYKEEKVPEVYEDL